MDIKFSKWFLEYADYGFEVKKPEKTKEGKDTQPDNDDAEPWKSFKVHDFFDELKYLINSDGKKSLKIWEEELSWLESGNVVEVNVNPFGSLRITTRKYIKDLNGKDARVCKNVIDIDDYEIKRERKTARYLYEKIKKFSKTNNEYPSKEYDLKRLSHDLFNVVRQKYPEQIMFPVGMKEMNENYYKIVFEFKGGGQGVPNSSIAIQFNIDLIFDKEKGLVRCWGYDIDSPVKKREYIIQPSEWDEYFSPHEKNSKIVGMIATTFMTY